MQITIKPRPVFFIFLLLCLGHACPVRAGLQPSAQLPIWDGPAPGAPANPGPETLGEGGRIYNVSTPILDVYLPAPGKADGRAIIIFGGGGYTHLLPGSSGALKAEHFLPEGITVFSLKYRLTPPSTDVLRDALADAKRTVRLVRSRAAVWHLNPHRIGVIGFSAGANLTLNLACTADSGDPSASDPLARFSCRPDFVGLFCTWPYNQKFDQFNITAAVPPAFVAHARDDKTAPFSFSEQITAAWRHAGVPVHFEPYKIGGHNAFSLPDGPAKDWPDKLLAWLRTEPFVTAGKSPR